MGRVWIKDKNYQQRFYNPSAQNGNIRMFLHIAQSRGLQKKDAAASGHDLSWEASVSGCYCEKTAKYRVSVAVRSSEGRHNTEELPGKPGLCQTPENAPLTSDLSQVS
jgi:hypothetical protein